MFFENNIEEKELLEKMVKVKDEIQSLQLWIDDARTNRIARIRKD